MTCLICQTRESETPQVCPGCRVRLRNLLDEIGDLHSQLLNALPPAATHGPKVSGSREAPLPLNVDALDLLGRDPLDLMTPYRQGDVRDLWRDQTGHVSVAAILDQWTREWIEVRGIREKRPIPTVPVLTGWLGNRLDWACDKHHAVDAFAGELGQLRGVLCGTLRLGEPRPEQMAAPCPSCDLDTLVRQPGEAKVECANADCGRVLTDDEYERWARQLIEATRRAA